jgi:hypothetical protein
MCIIKILRYVFILPKKLHIKIFHSFASKIEIVDKNNPDYKLMRKTDNEETYSLEEVKKLLCK